MEPVELMPQLLGERVIPVRLGYLLEGTLRDHVCDRGGFRNIEVYGKISSDIK